MQRMSGGKRGSVVSMEKWTPGGDPMLALLPAELPLAFQRLPREEQAWRGRCFLIAYVMTNGGALLSWSIALNTDPRHAVEGGVRAPRGPCPRSVA
jgi:hypothetical protein